MRNPFVISLICVVGALALFFLGFSPQLPPPPTAESRYVLLIENDTGTFLMQLRKGMQEAAAMQNARLSVQIVSENHALQAAELASTAPAAALLLLNDPAPMLEALTAEGIPALVLDQSLRGYVCVTSNNQQAGEALVQHALTLAEPAQILLFADAQDPRSKERANGAADLARRRGIKTLSWREGVSIPEDCRVAIALSSRATLALASDKANGSLPQNFRILGVDPGDARVQLLEKGLVSALTIDSPYAMGYLAIEKAQQLTEGLLPPSLHFSNATLIHTENMYLSENTKLVFPLLQ